MNMTACIRIFDRIVDDIDEDLPDAVLVAVDKGQHFRLLIQHADLILFGTLHIYENGISKLGQNIHRAHLQREVAALHPREIQQLLDHFGKALRLADDDMQPLPHHLRIGLGRLIRGHIGQRFRPALDRGQRGAQLMGDRADEFILHRLRSGKLVGHVVDAGAELADLVLALLIDAGGEIALREFFGIRVDLADRAQDRADEIEVGKSQQHQHRDGDQRHDQHEARDGIVNGFQRGHDADRAVFLADIRDRQADSHDALAVCRSAGADAVGLILLHRIVIIRHTDRIIRRKAGGGQNDHAVIVDRHQLHFVLVGEALQRTADLRIEVRSGIGRIARQNAVDRVDLRYQILPRRIIEIVLHGIDQCQLDHKQDQDDHGEIVCDPAAGYAFFRHACASSFSGDCRAFPPICSRSPRSS